MKGAACGNFRRRAKNDKKLMTPKKGSCDQFFAEIKFFEPGKAG